MIDGRIRIETRHDQNEQQIELLIAARQIAESVGKDVVKVEVEYPSEVIEGTWNESGDALEIDFRTFPTAIKPLPPYSEETP